MIKRIWQGSAWVALLLGLLIVAWLFINPKSLFYKPIKQYQLLTDLQQVSAQQLDKAVSPFLGLSFWEMPIHQLQAGIIRLDWVYRAEVKRKWPDLLYISIEEQQPVARWGESGLVNRQGQVFFPNSIAGFENLVQLNGSLAESELVLRRFIVTQQKLHALALVVAGFSLSVDDVWTIRLLDGPKIVVDSLKYSEKLQRFIKAYPKLDKQMRNSASVYDLRYSNGFIVAKK